MLYAISVDSVNGKMRDQSEQMYSRSGHSLFAFVPEDTFLHDSVQIRNDGEIRV